MLSISFHIFSCIMRRGAILSIFAPQNIKVFGFLVLSTYKTTATTVPRIFFCCCNKSIYARRFKEVVPFLSIKEWYTHTHIAKMAANVCRVCKCCLWSMLYFSAIATAAVLPSLPFSWVQRLNHFAVLSTYAQQTNIFHFYFDPESPDDLAPEFLAK